jgi:hypothetical protein
LGAARAATGAAGMCAGSCGPRCASADRSRLPGVIQRYFLERRLGPMSEWATIRPERLRRLARQEAVTRFFVVRGVAAGNPLGEAAFLPGAADAGELIGDW